MEIFIGKRIFVICLFVVLVATAYAGGFDVKTSSIIDQPGAEVLGDYKGSWYVIGFENEGTLNKPPRYKIFKYSQGFKNGTTSVLYPSFGEKTLYLQATFVSNKISIFYAKCGKREDVAALLDKREGHKQLPIIMRQDYDPITLEPTGEAEMIFNEEDEFFSASGIDLSESYDRSKTAILIKPYYKQLKYKVIITDNNTGEVFAKTFEFKLLKEYLKFLKMRVSNAGEVIIETKVRDDVITLTQNSSGKNQVKYFFFSVNKGGDEAKQLDFVSPVGNNKYFTDPVLTILNNGETLIAYDYFQNPNDAALKGTSVFKYGVGFNAIGDIELTADSKFISNALGYHTFKRGKEFTHLATKQILPLGESCFVLIAEYHDTIDNTDKTKAGAVERNYLITYRIDENMSVKAQRFIAKKQISPLFDYAFSVQAYAKGNDVYMFHNDNWESDEEHNMNLQCTLLPADGSEPVTQKVVNTSNDFFTSMEQVFISKENKVLFTEEKLVDYANVTRERKLLEITIK